MSLSFIDSAFDFTSFARAGAPITSSQKQTRHATNNGRFIVNVLCSPFFWNDWKQIYCSDIDNGAPFMTAYLFMMMYESSPQDFPRDIIMMMYESSPQDFPRDITGRD